MCRNVLGFNWIQALEERRTWPSFIPGMNLWIWFGHVWSADYPIGNFLPPVACSCGPQRRLPLKSLPGSCFSLWGSWDALHYVALPCTENTLRRPSRNAEWAPWKNGHRRCGFPAMLRCATTCYDVLRLLRDVSAHWWPVTCDRKLGRRFIALDPKQWT